MDSVPPTPTAAVAPDRRRPANCGYESPDDDHPPPGMTASPRPGRMQQKQQQQVFRRPFGDGGLPRNYSLNDVVSRAKDVSPKVGIRDRIGGFQWTGFTMTMVCDFPLMSLVIYLPTRCLSL